MRSFWIVGWMMLVLAPPALAQLSPVNGMRPAPLRVHALVDATVVVRPGEVIEGATIVIRCC